MLLKGMEEAVESKKKMGKRCKDYRLHFWTQSGYTVYV